MKFSVDLPDPILSLPAHKTRKGQYKSPTHISTNRDTPTRASSRARLFVPHGVNIGNRRFWLLGLCFKCLCLNVKFAGILCSHMWFYRRNGWISITLLACCRSSEAFQQSNNNCLIVCSRLCSCSSKKNIKFSSLCQPLLVALVSAQFRHRGILFKVSQFRAWFGCQQFNK